MRAHRFSCEFDSSSERMAATRAQNLTMLRRWMGMYPTASKKGVQAIYVPSEDAHLSEYITDHDKRLEFISGFSGSLGTAIITLGKAALWTDGRYYMQADKELDPRDGWILMRKGMPGTPTEEEWLISELPAKSIVVADSRHISYATWMQLQHALASAGHTLIPGETNLIDKVWGPDQPPIKRNPIVPQLFQYTGRKAGDKFREVREEMRKRKVGAMVITNLDEIAYMLNLRGSDIPYNPVFFAYLIITTSTAHFFVDKTQLTLAAQAQLVEEGVSLKKHRYKEVVRFLGELTKQIQFSLLCEQIWIHNDASYRMHHACGKAKRLIAPTPPRMMKIVKNEVEIANMKNAHIRDASALVKYFAWLEEKVKNHEHVTEISGADKLEAFRKELTNFVGLSFATISSVGPHAAIVHYHPDEKSDVPITDDQIYLCDSGAQYLDGTTDVTRTFHFGTPTDYQRECFTRVFKGQFALATAVFPIYIKGNYLDTLARKSLWDVGLHYLHGTGHGVGAYLCVHEGPSGISWKPYPDDPGVQPGTFYSNEPGFYEDGEFGVRLENVQYAVHKQTKFRHRDLPFLTFEQVTFVPIQQNLLDVGLLTDEELNYLNDYHAKCLEILKPHLEGPENAQALNWLVKETKPISRL